MLYKQRMMFGLNWVLTWEGFDTNPSVGVELWWADGLGLTVYAGQRNLTISATRPWNYTDPF